MDAVTAKHGGAPCAVDTEADSLHCYEEKLCLVQFTAGGRLALIDPLAIDDLSPLVDFLDSTEVWLHGADFDMRMWRRTFGSIASAAGVSSMARVRRRNSSTPR